MAVGGESLYLVGGKKIEVKSGGGPTSESLEKSVTQHAPTRVNRGEPWFAKRKTKVYGVKR